MSKLELYRPNVGIVIFNSNKKIWLGKRFDVNTKHGWQLPQGGIDNNEEPLIAAKREAYEETGIKSIRKIDEINEWIQYKLPKEIAENIWGGKFLGQNQKWYLFHFYGNEDEININKCKYPEFSKWKWSNEKYIINNVTKFRKDVYEKVFQNFRKSINNYC